ncbi:hypothetical protein KKH03_01410 [Patescibacteria group bacterium]|nr:hypothetical protein [Patescibacteria group bacterium]
MINEQIIGLTDKELYNLCRQCGANIRTFNKEFAGYLPEVEKRKLHKKYGCHTLYEFAAKLAGMSQDTVDDIMNVHKKLEDKPALQSLIVTQGWSKVKVVATIARPETEKFWAEKVREMAKGTLKTFVKELRKENNEIMANGQTGLFADTTEFERANKAGAPSPVHEFWPGPSTPMEASQKTAITFKLDADSESKLRIFKHRLEKKTGEPQDWNQAIKELLEIVEQHEACASGKKRHGHASGRMADDGKGRPRPASSQKPVPTVKKEPCPGGPPTKEQIQKSLPQRDKRYIPARVKHFLQQKFQGTCGYPACKNPSKIYHHTKRFSLDPIHNPDHIVPLCEPHERLAHHGLIENETMQPENWKIQIHPDKNAPEYLIDRRVQRFRATER